MKIIHRVINKVLMLFGFPYLDFKLVQTRFSHEPPKLISGPLCGVGVIQMPYGLSPGHSKVTRPIFSPTIIKKCILLNLTQSSTCLQKTVFWSKKY